MTGPDPSPGQVGLRGEEAAAWTGLLRVHRRLTRTLEEALQRRHGLSLSALEALTCLAGASERRLRIARLAEQTDLSLSRTSRLLDALAARGLLAREPCPEDSRASNVWLTPAGLALAQQAQSDHLTDVRRLFVDRLTPDQIKALATALRSVLAPGP
jgi:DNA-binding MarR family transcriptional regulator